MKLLLTTIAAVLVVGCGPSVPDISIHDAAYNGNIEAVEQHLAAGTDVNAKDDWGKTPLYVAALGGHKEIAELLIAKGADVNAKVDGGVTTLQLAASRGHKELAELLIAEGADINAKDEDGHTPLHQAALDGQKEVAELLIAKGADVNVIGGGKVYPTKETPLDVAVRRKRTKTADLLHKHGGKTAEELKAEGK